MAITIISNYRKPQAGIIQSPNPMLRLKSEPVAKIDDSIHRIVNQLTKVLKEVDKSNFPWLGMAAPQVGYNKRIIAIKRGFRQYTVMINPEVLEQKFLFPTISGCYSLKGLYLTKSHYWFKIKYQDLEGRWNKYACWGGQAVMLQQELDHLDGKLVCD
ncbi:MAG: peptide deformylase [Candidatus Levybacteria bacterium]|nr:peptide deformylase [Candidatus Levybacteria bacterium]